MNTTSITPERIQSYLATGLRNHWYPVLPSYRVQSAPLGITRLGENIALWRDRDGAVHAIADRCPHRGARISLGWNLGDRLACWYHGVEVNGAGRIVDVPAVEICPMKDERQVHAYPVAEHNGAIFLWFSDASRTAPTPLLLPEQLTSPAWAQMLCTAHWQCNWQYAVDNVMDPMHGQYLHAKSHSMAFGDQRAQMQTRKTSTGLVFEKIGQRDVNFDWVEWGESGGLWMRLSIPYRERYGPGGSFYIVGFATPIDAHHTQVFFWRCREVDGWQRDVWKFMYRNRLEGLHWDVLEQDRVILENLSQDARDHEFLYQHDTGLARVRRRCEQLAAEQLAAADQSHVTAK
ncbi:MAG: aromatic ring-hydroxylating dioxygenase subunit alpha [Betaproteobacteria bacterium]|nr:aromatic ring-hydroxylating dioxygenase subunit alpha [Betaproteobacteria bacterium]